MIQILSDLDAIQDPKAKGHAFERVSKWILRNALLYRSQLKDVWLWREFPRSWGPDTGIDLVADPEVGGYWAIQAKGYGEEQSVSWRSISTFVGASAARDEVGALLLITTAGSVAPNARRNLAACGKPVTILTRDSLLSLDLPDVPLSSLRPTPLQPFEPREASA